MDSTYRILSLDGGGIRGVLTARVIERLVERKPDLLDKLDMVAGTSTGAILACGLASGRTPREIIQLYEEKGPSIFRTMPWKRIPVLGFLFSSKYGSSRRKKALEETFGSAKLEDLTKHVIISTFLLDDSFDPKPHLSKPGEKSKPRWKAKFFHNLRPVDGTYYGGESVVDVVMRSSAAPLFFPIYQHYVDGGVVANNPSVCAFAQVLDAKTPIALGKRIQILSLGTGSNAESESSERGKFGLWRWGMKLVGIVAGGQVGLAHYQCAQILGPAHYCRVDPTLETNIPLDDVKAIPHLLGAADNVDLDEAVDFINDW
jgi:patatin-like phospholipase/acyl hydrolase